MRNPGGYAFIFDPGVDVFNGIREYDTFSCVHCNKVVFVKPRCDPADAGGFCTCCGDHICKDCVGKPCDHLQKKLARMETRRNIYEVI